MIFARLARYWKRKEASPLETIMNADRQLLAAPWKGSPCMVMARELSDIEISALGNFSLIETDEYKWSQAQTKRKWSEVREYCEMNVKICKAALVSPTYDEIFEAVGKTAFNTKVEERIKHIGKMLDDMPDGPARQELEEIRDSLVVAWEIILPQDFMTTVACYALKIAKTDIKKVTEEMLYTAAVLASRGHKAPHEYIHGVFSNFNIEDIDLRAWNIYDERIKKLNEESSKPKEE